MLRAYLETHLPFLYHYVFSASLFCALHLALVLWVTVELVKATQARKHEQSASGREERIRGHIGFFLLIGIAGTFAGFFDFALEAQRGGADVEKALLRACSKAFPVGLFGIAWTFLFHFICDAVIPVEHLHTRDADAIPRRQGQGAPPPVPATIADVRDLLQASGLSPEAQEQDVASRNHLAAILGALPEQLFHAIRTSFPVAEAAKLEMAVADVKTVVVQLGNRVAEVTVAVKELHEVVGVRKRAAGEYASRLETAAGSVASATEALRGAVTGLAPQIASALDASKVLGQVADAVRELTREAGEASRETAAAAQRLSDAGDGLAQATEGIKSVAPDAIKAIGEMTTGVRESARGLSEDLLNEFRQKLTAAGELLAGLTRDSRDGIETLSTGLNRLTSGFTEAAVNGFGKLAADLKEGIKPEVERIETAAAQLADQCVAAAQKMETGEKALSTPLSALARDVELLAAQSAALKGQIEGLSQALVGLTEKAKNNQRVQVESPDVAKAVREMHLTLGKMPTSLWGFVRGRG